MPSRQENRNPSSASSLGVVVAHRLKAEDASVSVTEADLINDLYIRLFRHVGSFPNGCSPPGEHHFPPRILFDPPFQPSPQNIFRRTYV